MICILRQAERNDASTQGEPPLHMSDRSSVLSPVTNVPVSRCRPANVRHRSACLRIHVMNIHVFCSNRQLVSPPRHIYSDAISIWHAGIWRHAFGMPRSRENCPINRITYEEMLLRISFNKILLGHMESGTLFLFVSFFVSLLVLVGLLLDCWCLVGGLQMFVQLKKPKVGYLILF